MGEYDDDYDDQYDEVDIKLGTTDDGFTMDNDGMTFEQVKLYNQILREDESDSSFWEGARNTNRQRDGGRRRDGDGGGTNSRPSSRSNSPKKNGNHNNNSNNNNKKTTKPRTKPKSDNRVSRQRDRKQT